MQLNHWVICQIADKSVVNIRISNILGIPHVACLKHKLNLLVKKLTKDDLVLMDTLNRIEQECMTSGLNLLTVQRCGILLH